MKRRHQSPWSISKKFLNDLSDGVIVFDKSNTIIFINNKAIHWFGSSYSAIIGSSIKNVIPLEYDLGHEQEYVLKTKDNQFLLMNISIQTMNDRFYICTIKKREQSNIKIQEMDEQLKQVVNGSLEGIAIVQGGKLKQVDETLADMFGYDKEELEDETSLKLFTPRNKKKISNMNYNQIIEVEALTKSKAKVLCEVVKKKLVSYRGSKADMIFIRDITIRKRNEEKMKHLAYYDDLTGLVNRNYFMRLLDKEINEAKKENKKLAVLVLDIDSFKNVNDLYGHFIGDELLKKVAYELNNKLNDIITIARMGGDEFLILVKDEKEIEYTSSIIKETFMDAFLIEERELYLTLSIGLSLFPEHGESSNELLRNADTAMYAAKTTGGDALKVYDKTMHEHLLCEVTLNNELQYALKKDQFELHYQPQIDLKDGQIIGVEGLIRWNHPELGLISPGEFIPLAEKTGLIKPIGEWVIREAAKQGSLWEKLGCPVRISVNLSVQQFHQENLVQNIKKILEETRFSPEFLELEITESVAMTNEENNIKVLQSLRDLGIHVSIDDFGTGYSSLMYLSKFPVNKLKIDKGFIHQIHSNNASIVKSIIALSHQLQLKVIAEGVENEEQLSFLRNENCDEYQGYFYSKPVPANDVFQLIKALKKEATEKGKH